MRSVSHKPDILRSGVYTLSVLYRSLEHVTELRFATEVVWTHEVHHTPVFQ